MTYLYKNGFLLVCELFDGVSHDWRVGETQKLVKYATTELLL